MSSVKTSVIQSDRPKIDIDLIETIKPTKSKNKLGRKPFFIEEITTKEFSVSDLIKLNSNIKKPTIRAFIARNVMSGRYILIGTEKNKSGRGKPLNIYKLNK